jgi:hypothetical protein
MNLLWLDHILVRAVMLAALTGGAYVIYRRLPDLIEPTLLAEFPVVTTVIAIFAALSVLHWGMSTLTGLMRKGSGGH